VRLTVIRGGFSQQMGYNVRACLKIRESSAPAVLRSSRGGIAHPKAKVVVQFVGFTVCHCCKL